MLSITLAIVLLLVLVLLVSHLPNRTTRGNFAQPARTHVSSSFRFQEVCRSVLNTSSFRFVAANAPAAAVDSFGMQQQRIARLSLEAASAMLVERLRKGSALLGGQSQSVHAFLEKLQDGMLLTVCTICRAGLGVLRGLRAGIPQRLQIWFSASMLTEIGSLMLRSEEDDEGTVAGVDMPPLRSSNVLSANTAEEGAVTEDILRALRESLPNEVSCLIFLATLRDNNSGHYYHPEVARRFSEDVADKAMLACHRHIYGQVVALPLEDLTDQLDAYMATVRAPRQRLIESWTKLRAYRTTIPIDADPISTEIYYMKVEVAVAILEARLLGRTQ